MRRLALAALSAGGLTLNACHGPALHEAEYFVFGTEVLVTLEGVDEDLANRAFSDLQPRLQAMHDDWHAWEPGKLTQLNRAFAAGQAAASDAQLSDLVRLSQWAEQSSQGRFNATIGQLVALWGFHTSEYPVLGPPPSAEAIRHLIELRPSSLDIHIEAGNGRDRLFSDNAAVQLDLGGLAKGYAVDLVCARLKQLGVDNGIVNAGGDLLAFGANGSRPWRVAVQNPLGGVLGGLEISRHEAVFTSGNYQRFRETESGERYPHIIDPRTGWPASEVMSATVVAGQGWLADAAATALVVAGMAEWPEVAASMGVDKVLVVDESGTVFVSPALFARLELSDSIRAFVVELGP